MFFPLLHNKCPVCKQNYGYKCLFDFIVNRISSLIKHPRIYLFFLKSIYLKRMVGESNELIKINRKTSLIKRVFEHIIEHCEYYNEDLVFSLWNKNLSDFLINDDISLFNSLKRKYCFKFVYIANSIPVHNDFLFIDSIKKQSYANWKLIVLFKEEYSKDWIQWYSDNSDSRILIDRYDFDKLIDQVRVYTSHEKNILCAVIQNPVRLVKNALLIMAGYLSDKKNVDLLYTDHSYQKGEKSIPVFKNDWNQDLFYSSYYLGELVLFQKIDPEIFIDKDFKVCNINYCLIINKIKCKKNLNILHLPLVLYNSFSYLIVDYRSLIPKLYSIFASKHFNTKIIYDKKIDSLHYKLIPTREPLVSIIIPTRDNYLYLSKCIESVIEKTNYQNFEIIIINNNSKDEKVLRYLNHLEKTYYFIRVIQHDFPFNFSAINNYAVHNSNGEFLCFLNDDTEIISLDWLSQLVSHALRPGIGVVGAKLYYNDNTIQHTGVILGLGGIAGHLHRNLPKESTKYFYNTHLMRNYLAVTAACMLIKRSIFQDIGGFNENDYKVAYNDIDLCLRVYEAGYRNILIPAAELYHYEYASRGDDRKNKNIKRYLFESKKLMEKWGNYIENDPFYNPNLTIQREDNRIITKTRFKLKLKNKQ